MEDNTFVSFQNELSLEYVLMQDVEGITAQSLRVEEQLNPFSNKPQTSKTNAQNAPFIRGFTPAPNLTHSVRKLAVSTTKYVLFNSLKLLNNLANLSANAPNKNAKQSIDNIKGEVFVSAQVLKNILRQLSNNPAFTFQNPEASMQNTNFCGELEQALVNIDKVIKGLIKLSNIIFIPNLNLQIQILINVYNNIQNNLQSFKIYC